ncbi:ATP-binding/protein serine/threonine kinase [Hibiscus syriacus]|uniref:ATP-binding/protein serine/threonine kinase n=1 Tax=Hibiscus syriacus TaxID=106335 RepID=A0A6A2ZSQ2_HIBSY|nr:ATP-binding/protein serine/threonine kinase [Hibiscus syriacus]
MPFCSEECRQEQIDINEAKEKSNSLSSSMKALRKKDQRKSTTSPAKAQNYLF